MRYIKQGIARNGVGTIVPSATISVYLAGTTTAASVYAAASGGAAVNSVTSGDDGSFTFYVSRTDYDWDQLFKVVISKAGHDPSTWDYVAVFPYDYDQYYVDALMSYGSGTSYTKATIDAALTAIGTTTKTTLLLRPGTWVFSADADYSAYTNITWKIPAGAVLQIATTKTLTLAGTLESGLYEQFDCVGTGKVVFKTGVIHYCHPVWFSGSDYGLQINSAIASIKDIGGTVVLSKSATVTTPINATGLTQGMIFQGCGASFDGETTNLMLKFALTTVGFDCSDSNNIHFKDFSIDTDSVTYPQINRVNQIRLSLNRIT